MSLLRNEQTAGKAGRVQNMNLGNMKFLLRFQIRQMLREIRSAFAVVIGMFICLLILMLSIDCAVLCINFGNACLEETNMLICILINILRRMFRRVEHRRMSRI